MIDCILVLNAYQADEKGYKWMFISNFGKMDEKWKKMIDKHYSDVYNNFCVTQISGASIFTIW